MQPFGFRALDDHRYTGAAHVKSAGTAGETVSFPEQQFSTEAEASSYAEHRVLALIGAGTLPRLGN